MSFMDMLNKLLPMRGGKTEVKYTFNILDPPKDDRYTILIWDSLPKSWWTQVITSMNRMNVSKERIGLPEEFEADPRMKGAIKLRLRPTLDKIVKDIQKDAPMRKLKLLTFEVDSMKFKSEGNNVKAEIMTSGVCAY